MKRLVAATLLASLPLATHAFELKVVSNSLDEELRAASLLTPLVEAETEASAQDIVAAAQADYARLVGLMYDRGYFSPQVSILVDGREASGLSPVKPPAQVGTVEVRVTTGEPFLFGTAQISPLAQKTTLPDAFASGQTATTGALQSVVDVSIAAWRNQGHAKADVASQTITARHAASRLDATIVLAPGPQLKFGDLLVNGNERMRTKRILDIAGLPTGEIYDPEELNRAGVRLRRAGVFSVVALTEAENISADNSLDIEAQFTESKRRRFGFGAELSAEDGLGFSGYWLHRNLFGGAERLRLGAEISGIGGENGGQDFELNVAFARPATFNEDTDFFVAGEISSVDEPNFSSDLISLEAGIRRYASDRREYTLALGFQSANDTDAFGNKSYTILTVPLTAEFDYRDNPLDAKKGYYAKASITPFLNINGTSNGVRGHLDLRAYKTIDEAERVTFALRSQIGFLSGPSLTTAPSSFLFFSGGGGTVRGQDFQSLGVELSDGSILGGRSFLGLSGEVRVKTGDKLSIVGFYDAGYVGSEEFPDGASGDWHSGIGAGVRYATGIGPVRLDVGFPVSGPDTSSGIGLYIGIGQSF